MAPRPCSSGPWPSVVTSSAWAAIALRCHGSGIVDTMRTTIDKAGRLVIPRPLRDRIGLAGGGEVEVELDGAAIRIQPVSGSGLREDAGFTDVTVRYRSLRPLYAGALVLGCRKPAAS